MDLIRLDIDPPLTIWSADLVREPAPCDIALLSQPERQRAVAFNFNVDRRRYLVAHIALRHVLAAELALPLDGIRFELNRFGKPRLSGRNPPGFSLSYAGDTAVIATAPTDVVGVDAERMRPLAEVTSMTEMLFAPGERPAIEASRLGTDRDAMFLHGWVRKEACMKAAGTGVSTSPASFVSGFGPGRQRTTIVLAAGIVEVEVESFIVDQGIASAWARIISGTVAATAARDAIRIVGNSPS